jgi:hypothetical protein
MDHENSEHEPVGFAAPARQNPAHEQAAGPRTKHHQRGNEADMQKQASLPRLVEKQEDGGQGHTGQPGCGNQHVRVQNGGETRTAVSEQKDKPARSARQQCGGRQIYPV